MKMNLIEKAEDTILKDIAFERYWEFIDNCDLFNQFNTYIDLIYDFNERKLLNDLKSLGELSKNDFIDIFRKYWTSF